MGKAARAAGAYAIGLAMCTGLGGCLVVSYSSESGWWVWPGSVVVTLGLVALWWVMRRH